MPRLNAVSIALLLFGTGCTKASPFAAGDLWSGSYQCRQGSTRLVLRITEVEGQTIHAIFDFDHRESGAAGEFELRGQYDRETRALVFKPGAWIKQPANYVTVGMDGRVSEDGMTYLGKIPTEGCDEFRVSRLPGRRAERR
jgi:hypothetical protein